jgi:hypothetical protein
VIENVIGWTLLVCVFLIIGYVCYRIYSRYIQYQEKQTQRLAYEQKLKEEFILGQQAVWTDKDDKNIS